MLPANGSVEIAVALNGRIMKLVPMVCALCQAVLSSQAQALALFDAQGRLLLDSLPLPGMSALTPRMIGNGALLNLQPAWHFCRKP
jgi:hypothetical protein